LEDVANKELISMKSRNTKNYTYQEHEGNVKFEVYGEEMFDKLVTRSGNSGRVYLPPHWVGCRVKIISADGQ
jgi:putative transposon-encoded protein